MGWQCTGLKRRGKEDMNTNDTLRLLRELLNLSIQEVADATGLSFRTVLRAEQGAALNPESRRRLCQFYGKTSEELGLVPRRRQAEPSLSLTTAKEYELTSIRNAEGRDYKVNL
jgi:transcriptional regulator with XRE-family HTH domain